ncbi:hypothetical protein [Kitasatospora purpeofusca]|uniref:hypothetical protein n=1 Tax=Kitasatospora purpeofusca TaxID=67352 RepID=UPI0035E30080
MENSPELQAISNASTSELMLICTAAAERGASFCRTLGTSELLTWVDASLELAWAAASGESVQDECAEALDELEMEPQEGEDDSSRPEFYLTQAVGLVGNALANSLRPSAAKTEMSINTIRSLLSMIDFKLGGERPMVVPYGTELPPPGPLAKMEIDAERRVISLFNQGEVASQDKVIASAVSARASSGEFATHLSRFIGEFSEISHWEI